MQYESCKKVYVRTTVMFKVGMQISFIVLGGLKKGHPTKDEIRKAVEFYQNLL